MIATLANASSNITVIGVGGFPTNDFTITPLSADKQAGISGVTAYTFTVTRASDPSQPDSGTYKVTGTSDAPARGSDFEGGMLPSGSFSFAAGQITTTITVNVLGHATPEPEERFQVSVSGGVGISNIPFDAAALTATGVIRTTGSPVTTQFSIEANPMVTDLNSAFYLGPDQSEGSPNVQGDFGIGLPHNANNWGSYLFTVYREGDLSQQETVNWAVSGSGTNPATADDFLGGVLPSGAVTFAPGAGSAQVQIDLASDFRPEPDQNFTVTLSNPSLGSSFDQASAQATIWNDDIPTNSGTTGNDPINLGTSTTSVFVDASQGGDDTVTGGSADDIFYFGGAYTAADAVNGGQGSDTLVLDGNYAASLTFGKSGLAGVENIYLSRGNSYNLTFGKTNVAAGSTIYVDASTLAEINSVTINGGALKGNLMFLGGAGSGPFLGGSASTNVSGGTGADTFIGGDGNDTFTGNAGNDTFWAGRGADTMNGGKGANVFIYDNSFNGAEASPIGLGGGAIDTSGADTLVGFQTKADKIDLSAFNFGSIGKASVSTAAVAGFSANAGNGLGFFGSAGVRIEYAAASKTTSARIYVDANANGNLDSGDMLIQANSVTRNGITAANFKF